MGIKDLVPWIKKKHSKVIQTFPKRWESPEIKGKRIAIDATLLTNRFHFAMREGELRGKGALIGWYNLINVMRMHDIKPIAVWDRPGTRAWKFGENKRRWITRGLNFARREHEDKREERLTALRDAFEELERMDEAEQGAVRDHLDRAKLVSGLGKERGKGGLAEAAAVTTAKASGDHKRVPAPAKRDQPVKPADVPDRRLGAAGANTATLDPSEDSTPDELASLQRIADMVDTLSAHITSYRASLQTPEISLFPTQTVLEEALERVKELEDLYESFDEPEQDVRMRPAPRAGTPAPIKDESEPVDEPATDTQEDEPMHEALRLERERERDQEWLVEKMSEIMPPSLFSESRRQAAMSVEEGRILDAFLGPSMPVASADGPSLASSPSTTPSADSSTRSEQSTPVDPLFDIDPQRRLADLLEAVPETRSIYDRALGQPTKHTYLDCQDLLHRMGVPVILADAPYEAEGLATALVQAGLADWVATEDSDVIPLGGPQLRHISTTKQPLSTVLTSSLLSTLSFTQPQFIDFCILLGNDAIPRIRSVGPARAFKLITEHRSIEAALAASPKIREVLEGEMEGYMEMVKTARAVFSQLPVITDEMRATIEQSGLLQGNAETGTGREAEVERWLEEKHGVAFVDAMVDRFEDVPYDEA